MRQIARIVVFGVLTLAVVAGCGKKRGGYFGPAPVAHAATPSR